MNKLDTLYEKYCILKKELELYDCGPLVHDDESNRLIQPAREALAFASFDTNIDNTKPLTLLVPSQNILILRPFANLTLDEDPDLYNFLLKEYDDAYRLLYEVNNPSNLENSIALMLLAGLIAATVLYPPVSSFFFTLWTAIPNTIKIGFGIFTGIVLLPAVFYNAYFFWASPNDFGQNNLDSIDDLNREFARRHVDYSNDTASNLAYSPGEMRPYK